MTTPLIPPGAEVRHVEVTGRRLRVLHAGPATSEETPVLLVHGGGTDNSAISWYRLIAPLSETREVWAIDLPGFGGSIDVPPVGGPRQLASVVAAALAEMQLGPVVVFGVSMGGDVALNLALEHPSLVAGLVLIAPGGLVPIFQNRAAQTAAWIATRAPDWLLVPATRVANRFVRLALRAIVHDPATLPDEVVDEFARQARHPRGGLGYGRYNQATVGRTRMLNDLSDQVDRITMPTLIFHGEDDTLVDPEGSCRAAARMPDANLVLVPDCGHWAQLEAHDRFLAEAEPFLAAIDTDERRS